MNNAKFMSRLLRVEVASVNPSKRQATTVIAARSSTSGSPPPDQNGAGPSPTSATSPPQQSGATSHAEISQRTIALINLPDTVNDARVRALAEPYGALRKVVLRPDHRGALVEFQKVNDAGKAAMALEGYEIDPGCRVTIGDVGRMGGQGRKRKGRLQT